MDGPMQSERLQKDRLWFHVCVESKKQNKWTKKKTTKQKQTQRYREKLRVARGKGVEEMGKIGEGD